MRTKYTINELLFKAYLICVVLGCILRNMFGEWKPIYDTYTFVSKGRWGTFFLSFSSVILFVLIFRCSIQYIKKIHVGIRILLISLIFYYLIWTILSLDKAPVQSVFFEAISTSVILLPVSLLLGFDNNIWNILKNELSRINILLCCCFYIAAFSFWSNYGINWPMNASYKGIFSCWFTSACIMTFIDFHKKNKRKIIYGNLLFIIAAAFITQSRAWVLQTLILLFVFVVVVVYLMMLMRRQKEKMSEIKIQIDQLQAQHDRLQKERDQLQERMNHLEEQREHLQMQTDQAFRRADEIEKICDEIWHHANTIHLYSSLAEEESKSITMKEKQKEIIRTTEEILNIIYKYKGDV